MWNLQDTLNYMGVTIIKSNHILSTDLSAGVTIGEAKYNLNFSAAEIKALTWQQSCVASLKLQGLKVDTVDDIRRNTVFTVASMMAGTGVMRPECACFHTASAGAGASRAAMASGTYLDTDGQGVAADQYEDA